MSESRKRWWAERKRLQLKLKYGLKITKEELLRAKEMQEIVRLIQVLNNGKIPEENSILTKRAGQILRDIIFEIIKIKNEPMDIQKIKDDLLKLEEDLILAEYAPLIEKFYHGKSLGQLIRELITVWRGKSKKIEKPLLKLLLGDNRFIRIDLNLFGIRAWPPKKFIQIYVWLVSKYRLTDPKKKEKFVKEAIKLINFGKAEFDKKGLIRTLKRM